MILVLIIVQQMAQCPMALILFQQELLFLSEMYQHHHDLVQLQQIRHRYKHHQIPLLVLVCLQRCYEAKHHTDLNHPRHSHQLLVVLSQSLVLWWVHRDEKQILAEITLLRLQIHLRTQIHSHLPLILQANLRLQLRLQQRIQDH